MYKIDHLSISQVSTFSRCEFQWYLKYVEQLTYPINSALVRGKAIHKGLAEIYLQKKATGEYNQSYILDTVNQAIENAGTEEEVEWDTARDKIKDLSINTITQYIQSGIPDRIKQYEILQVEKQLTYTIYTPEGEAVNIIGIPDLILLDRVIDFKTKTRKPSGIDIDFKFQTAFYTTVTQKPGIEIQFLICKSNPETVIMNILSDQNIRIISQMIFIKTHKKIMNSLIMGNFLPTGLFHPWACKFCGYAVGGKCPFSLSQAA